MVLLRHPLENAVEDHKNFCNVDDGNGKQCFCEDATCTYIVSQSNSNPYKKYTITPLKVEFGAEVWE